MIGTKHLMTALLVAGASAVRAQEGSIDPTFNPSDLGFGHGDGFNNYTYTVALQPDGKVIVGGAYTTFNGTSRNRIARLTSAGDLDTGFDPGSGANNSVGDAVVQPDGKILIAGWFTSYNGTGRNYIARLNSDGTLESSFNIGTGANGGVIDVLLQPNGKILIAGQFTSYNGTVRNRVARLNSDGTLDTSFDPGTGANSEVQSMARQPDGKILIAGIFTTVNGTARNRIARLNSDGSLDSGFNPGSGANNSVFACALQPNGKILIGGLFTSFNGTACNRIARLNSDGTLDAGFLPGSAANDYVRAIVLQPDGKALIGGRFVTFNGAVRNRLARLNTDGTLDGTFDPGQGANEYIHAMALQSDGKLLVTGDMTTYQGVFRNRIARITTLGGLDGTFNVVTGASGNVSCIAFQPDGRILIGGWFDNFNGIARSRIARLNADGSLDTTFDPGSGANSAVYAVVLQPDGKILIGGPFTGYNGTTRYHIARLNSDGSLDASFDPGGGPDYQPLSIALQPNGKILIAGAFTTVNGIARDHIAQLNSDGSLDTGFNPGFGTNDRISKVVVQPDGKVVIGGDFTLCDSIPRNRIARLNSTGSVDPSFDPGSGTDASVFDIALQPDGKILIAGLFLSFNGATQGRIARLTTSGNADVGFNTGSGANLSVLSLDLQPDGKILLCGWFTSVNAVPRQRVARLNSNGTLDLSFDPGTGPNGGAERIALQADGKSILGGMFTGYNGTGRNRIARINGTARTGIKLMLEGPFSGGQMTDALRTLPSFPLTEPFTAMGYAETAFAPGATIPSTLLSVTGNNAIVDWVLVEMRPVATPGVVAASRAVLLQRDGDVVDLDGVSTVGFAGLAAGSYCVAVKPRTHLPVMLSTSTPIIYGDAIATVDFTLPSTQIYDADAVKNIGGVMVLATGDAVFNENIQYTGANNDRDPILVRIGGSVPTATVLGYWREDVNMDGVVKYVGLNNDRDPILLNVGGSTPTVVRNAALP